MTETHPKPRMRTKAFVVTGVVVALILAGVVSALASASPDGLNRVAEDLGFASAERKSATADSPLADYSTKGVDHEFLSGGLAGVTGVLVVLAVGSGLGYTLRRRSRKGS
ncbi:MAG TPA: PDGLE domain-containing protein [Actinopolymorphaceae bacterium]|jgi:hypothetical protein